MTEKRLHRSRKLTHGMIRVILTFQIIPYVILSAVLIRSYSIRNHKQVERTVITSVENAGTLVLDNILSAIDLSRQASYDGVIKKSYESWLKSGDEGAMYREVTEYLSQTYKFSKSISNTILLYTEPMTMEYYTYSNMAGATYSNIDEFKRNTAQAVRLTARDLDTRTVMVGLNGHLYVVRNIVRSNYEPFTTLVMEVNTDHLFERMENVMWKKAWTVYLEEEPVYSSGESGGLDAIYTSLKDSASRPADSGMSTVYRARDAAAVMRMQVNGQTLWFVHQLDHKAVLSSRNEFIILYIVAFVTLIPLLVATFYYLYRNINQPIGALVKGSEKIRRGEYGTLVEAFDRNEEIGQLVDTFNHMSLSLKDSFNRIYVEEIAQRDATLKALQSQINPHFLNNTLEIINWKARMSGNDDVSEMISALSVMMNASLNRNNEMFIPVSEELSYVDAYLTILRERFGSRVNFTVQAEQKLLDVSIPRLIIQPLVENAVEHGADRTGAINAKLSVSGDRQQLLITVENAGEMTPEDEARVAELLGEELNSENVARRSIGIRNVHRRLRILYGPDSGLAIFNDGKGNTISRLCIRREKRSEHADTDKQA